MWKLTDPNKVAAFNLILLLTLHVFNKVKELNTFALKTEKDAARRSPLV